MMKCLVCVMCGGDVCGVCVNDVCVLIFVMNV